MYPWCLFDELVWAFCSIRVIRQHDPNFELIASIFPTSLIIVSEYWMHLLWVADGINSLQDLVMRLQVHRKLDRHTGCVNTVGFNELGDTLISGSDDQMVMLWDWDTGAVKLEFHSGHGGNVFQARFMPCTDDRTIVTCAADGEVGVLIIWYTDLVDHIISIILRPQ